MDHKRECIQPPIGAPRASISLAFMLVLWSMFLIQCAGQPPDSVNNATTTVQTVIRNGYKFEILPTPEQQLHYAKTQFTEPEEMRTALELFMELFPNARGLRAHAELELAYLTLGGDYRFADPAACHRAIDMYERIASQYKDLPHICAKAYWYMGWIYADLLKQKRDAVEQYQVVVSQYTDEILSRKPPVPWVAMVLPQALEKPMAVYEYPVHKWSSIALLEIIRNSEWEEEKWQAFEKLWDLDRGGLTMGYALRELVFASPALAKRVAARAGIYLDARLYCQPIDEEVRTVLEELESTGHDFSEERDQRAQ